jgi:hypothetical protein
MNFCKVFNNRIFNKENNNFLLLIEEYWTNLENSMPF